MPARLIYIDWKNAAVLRYELEFPSETKRVIDTLQTNFNINESLRQMPPEVPKDYKERRAFRPVPFKKCKAR